MKTILVIALFIVGLALSWAVTVAILALIAFLLGIQLSLAAETAIRLCLCLLSAFFKTSRKD